MRIGIVAPSPVPFAVGGAENLFWGLQDYINSETSHQCELVKVPSREMNFWELAESYEKFLTFDVAHFDVVISTKYPSWMVSHNRHVCYMLHTLRGLYDTYHFCKLPEQFNWETAEFSKLKNYMSVLKTPGKHNIEIIELLRGLRDVWDRSDNRDAFAFPGPLIRELVHALDAYGLSSERMTRCAAISRNVRSRPNYFPVGTDVSVIYPPPRLQGYYCGSDEYLFTVSRLDQPKRVGLLIDAMQYVRADIPLLIAGTGPDDNRLRALAERDDRIQFLGFVRDRELRDYYADALAVPFVPYDEDYGLVTIEAMRSSKPVLTALDSGGPNEFVRNGETGYSVSPDPEALAERIDYLCSHRDEARRMGKNGQDLVRGINWKSVSDGLLSLAIGAPERAQRDYRRSARRKLAVATTFPIFPPRGGGQARVFHLYRHLARFFDVEIVSLCNHGEASSDEWIAPGLREIRVPKSESHHLQEIEYSRSLNWLPITDIAMPLLYKMTPHYEAALSSAAAGAFAVVVSHPYCISAIRNCAEATPLWFEAHNVEYNLKRAMLPDSAAASDILDTVKKAEGEAWKAAKLVFACTQADLTCLNNLYGETAAHRIEVPNGVCVSGTSPSRRVEKNALKERLGILSTKTALFLGSWHGPNLDAVEQIIQVAEILPQITFLVIGSVGLAFQDRRVPSNLLMTGPVTDVEKDILQGAADIALNPMRQGSGSSLKMLDYAAAGLPILSTPFGARGFAFVPGVHYFAAELELLPIELTAALALDSVQERIAAAARDLVASRYSWSVIARNFMQTIGELQ